MRPLLLASRTAMLLPLMAMTAACAQAARPDPANTDVTSAETTVSLERSACFGACPTFQLQVQGDGKATLTLPSKPAAKLPAGSGPSQPLVLEGQVEPARVQALLRTLHEGQFERLDDSYRASITDMPGTTITLQTPTAQHATYVYAVPCASAAAKEGVDPARGPLTPVPDVFCQAAEQLDAMACTVYTARGDALPADRQARFPPRCDS